MQASAEKLFQPSVRLGSLCGGRCFARAKPAVNHIKVPLTSPLGHTSWGYWQLKHRDFFLLRSLKVEQTQRGTLQVRAGRSFLKEMKDLKTLKEPAVTKLEYNSPLQIVKYPDPRLRAKNARLEVFDDSLMKLASEMFDLMYNTDGVGLAAPQVGVNVRLMVYNESGERGKGQEIILVNPQIVKKSKETDIEVEGCLSFPEIEADVKRSLSVKVAAQDHTGKLITLSLRGWKARIFQHEYDHLEGVLFHDRMSEDVRDTVRPTLLELEEEFEKERGVPPPESAKLKTVV